MNKRKAKKHRKYLSDVEFVKKHLWMRPRNISEVRWSKQIINGKMKLKGIKIWCE